MLSGDEQRSPDEYQDETGEGVAETQRRRRA
jgi:hypothetical protein